MPDRLDMLNSQCQKTAALQPNRASPAFSVSGNKRPHAIISLLSLTAEHWLWRLRQRSTGSGGTGHRVGTGVGALWLRNGVAECFDGRFRDLGQKRLSRSKFAHSRFSNNGMGLSQSATVLPQIGCGSEDADKTEWQPLMWERLLLENDEH